MTTPGAPVVGPLTQSSGSSVGSPVGSAVRSTVGPPAPSAVASAEEADLIHRLRCGDEAAFEHLVERYGPPLARLARVYGTDAVAAEVVQETWIAVIRGLAAFEGRSSLRSWLYAIVRNIARRLGERERRQVPLSALLDDADTGAPSVDPRRFRSSDDPWAGHWHSYPQRWDELPEQRYLANEGVETARLAIDGLPPAQREVVTLRDIEGWTAEEVANMLGISAVNQRVLLHRGRSKVRAILEAAIVESKSGAEVHR